VSVSKFNIFCHIDVHESNIALREEEKELSYRELIEDADSFNHRLGVGRKLVFLQARNTLAAITALVGCLRGGHVVYLFGENDEPKLKFLLETYNPNWIVYHRENQPLDIIQRHTQAIPLHENLAILLSTSGSTGSPKFVKLSHKNLWSNASAIVEYLDLGASERAATTLKYNYSYGFSVLNSHLLCGASLALTEDSVTAPGFWTWFRQNGATSFAGVPYTFEMLDSVHEWARLPGLRYVTQAGGRLSADLVQRVAALGKSNGWRFFVMYGQTEASPRMAYLPPDEVYAHPDCIGRAIPGGELSLLDAAGVSVTETGRSGELIYRGDNVMMGYAQDASALATDETPPFLRTGDIAEQTSDGLFRIVGRASRFIKLFGLRINLDELQSSIRQQAPGAICTGTDEQLVIAIRSSEHDGDQRALTAWVSQTYSLPTFAICVLPLNALPVLDNGKPDYQLLLDLAAKRASVADAGAVSSAKEWDGIDQIFLTYTGADNVSKDSTFLTLAGDSLSYVVTSLAVEEYLGHLPAEWETKTVSELEALRGRAAAQGTASIHYLHSTRVLMLLLGIPFHVSMWFDTRQFSIFSAPQHSIIASFLYSSIHSFRMFAFFFISGYFAALILRRMAIGDWLSQQIKRLCVPMLTGAIILTPLEMAAIAIAPGRPGQAALPFWLHSMTSTGEYWLSTRWFLATLLGLTVIMALTGWLLRSTSLKTKCLNILQLAEKSPRPSWFFFLLGLAPVGLALAASSRILQSAVLLLGSFEYRTIFYYAPAYFLGAVMWARPQLFEWFLRPKRADWFAGALAFVAIIYLENSSGDRMLALYKAVWIPCGLLIARVVLSAMHRWFNEPYPWISSLIEASFVIYMLHMVFVLLLNDFWIYLDLWPWLAILLSSIGTFGASWLAYLLIRRSKILSFAFNGGPLRTR
jgi:acyl-CoA synthetase (AMP-forming)/AMP-acid ligase II/fucose 4-O-acetylase-like acetyltransferase